jgi:hypothetical protein
MRRTAEGLEMVALRDRLNQKCWFIKPEPIDGILTRRFDKWLPPYTALNSTEHPKDVFTAEKTAVTWVNNYDDVFPPIKSQPTGSQDLERLPEEYLEQITVTDMMKTPKYKMCGQDLRQFALNSRTVLRHSRVEVV